MREIKFRVWDKISKPNRMKTWGQLQAQYNNISQVFNSEGFELMQYTGLKDKHGKEIYEGDIVVYSVKGNKKASKTIMTFNEGHGAYLFGIYEGVKMPCGKKTRMNKYTRISVNNVEVIGNIYENPQLLEG